MQKKRKSTTGPAPNTTDEEDLSEAEKSRRQVEQVRVNEWYRNIPYRRSPKPATPPAPPAPTESNGMRHELLSLVEREQMLQTTVDAYREHNVLLIKKKEEQALTIKNLTQVGDRLQKTCDNHVRSLAAKELEITWLVQDIAAKDRIVASLRCDQESVSLKRSMSSLCSTEGNKKRMRAMLHPDKLAKEDQSAANTVRNILKL